MSPIRKAKWILPACTVAVALGLLISVQFQAQQKLDKAKETNAKRTAEITPYIQEAMKEKDRLQKTQQEIKTELDKYKNAPGGASPEIKAQIAKTGILTGETDVEGPGVHIEIDDRKVAWGFSIQDYLMEIVNVLKYAGAEAIEVNGQRIGTRTAIVPSGSANTLINGVPISRINGTHWEVEAIGNQEVLSNYVQTLSIDPYKTQMELDVTITSEIVKISSLKEVNEFSFAKPAN